MEELRRAIAPFVETGMLPHLQDEPDSTPIRIECNIEDGYAITITLGKLRELHRVYNALRVLAGLKEVPDGAGRWCL
jgi:hypothetical protein